jgi:hypothetical protein
MWNNNVFESHDEENLKKLQIRNCEVLPFPSIKKYRGEEEEMQLYHS